MTFRHTIIGAATFHGRVRNGNGWCHRAKITRGLGCVVCLTRTTQDSGDRLKRGEPLESIGVRCGFWLLHLGPPAAHWQLHTGKLRTRI